MRTLFYVIALALALPALAQEHTHHLSPYAGMQNRAIKTLSEQQVSDLRAGKGMSLALAAELNGYPGPAHVLELAEPIGLSSDQQRRTQNLFEHMQAETRTLGESVIAAEAALDRLFREKMADATSVQDAVANAAQAQGKLRAAHLRYHLDMLDVLTPAQLETYAKLRGYSR